MDVDFIDHSPGMKLLLSGFNRNFPDDLRSGVNIRAFPAFLQDRREVVQR
jgi:hypothetical protein